MLVLDLEEVVSVIPSTYIDMTGTTRARGFSLLRSSFSAGNRTAQLIHHVSRLSTNSLVFREPSPCVEMIFLGYRLSHTTPVPSVYTHVLHFAWSVRCRKG
jgi:hypothetical protein